MLLNDIKLKLKFLQNFEICLLTESYELLETNLAVLVQVNLIEHFSKNLVRDCFAQLPVDFSDFSLADQPVAVRIENFEQRNFIKLLGLQRPELLKIN